MKAEQRKQLEKNELASHLDRLWKGAGDAKSSSTIWVVVGAVIIVGVLVFAWRYYASESQKNRAEVWRQIEQATTEKEFEKIIEENRGTEVARVAKAELARISFSEGGLNKLCSEIQRKDGIVGIQKARDLYDQLVKEAADDKQLLRESMLSRAKAEEALVGIPKEDNPAESRGSLDKALELYQEMAAKFAEAPQGIEAAERAKTIRENKQKIQLFYDELNKRFAKSEFPKFEPPPPPELPFVTPPKINDPLPPPPKPVEPPAKTTPMTPLAPPPGTAPPKTEPPKADPPKVDPAKTEPPKPKTDPPK
jgi:hypothetical protein